MEAPRADQEAARITTRELRRLQINDLPKEAQDAILDVPRHTDQSVLNPGAFELFSICADRIAQDIERGSITPTLMCLQSLYAVVGALVDENLSLKRKADELTTEVFRQAIQSWQVSFAGGRR